MGAKVFLAVLLVASLAFVLVAPAPHQSNQFFNNPCISGDTRPILNSLSFFQVAPAASSARCGVQSSTPSPTPAPPAPPAPTAPTAPPTPGSGAIINHYYAWPWVFSILIQKFDLLIKHDIFSISKKLLSLHP